MSYLLDRQIRRKRYFTATFFTLVIIVLFYFRTPVIGGLSHTLGFIFTPVVKVGNSVGSKIHGIGSYFAFKSSLSKENENLKEQLEQNKATMANYDSILAENDQLKETLGRKNENTKLVVAAILSKPNQSPYDTLVIDVGSKNEVRVGAKVFAEGNMAIGKVAEVYYNSSKVVLYSNPGEKTEMVISGKNSFLESVGRGGGNFEIIMPKDFTLSVGTEVDLPGLTPYPVAKVESILSDPRDSFVRALLSSPANIQTLKFVEVEK
jgi:cell shape-determining protein MreC